VQQVRVVCVARTLLCAKRCVRDRLQEKPHVSKSARRGAPLVFYCVGKCGPPASTQFDLWAEADDAHVWQKRFYDFNVWTERKHVEKLRYMHRNPVKRGFVATPDQWAWSSFRAYAYGEKGQVRVNFQDWALKIKRVKPESFGESAAAS
jgi:hypothetical protein